MENSDLIQQMKAEDPFAFEKIVDIHSDSIERLSFQYGCTREQALHVTVETFRTFRRIVKTLDEDVQPKVTLYRIALEKLANIQLVEQLQNPILSFVDDQQLHKKIIHLEKNVKTSLILSKFHSMDEMDISKIVGISQEVVKESLLLVVNHLLTKNDKSLLDKRLELLNRSYSRIRTSFTKDMDLLLLKESVEETNKTRKTISKKAGITWIVGILALLILITVPYFSSVEYKRKSAERYIEKLKVSFDEEVSARFQELGVSVLTKEEAEGNMYGKQARHNFEEMLSELKPIVETGAINKHDIGAQYGEIIKMLELPSAMVERLLENPLTDDKEKSEEFIEDYTNQFVSILQVYQGILSKYDEIISKSTSGNVVDVNMFLENAETYPEELQKALKAMKKQNVYLTPTSNNEMLIPKFIIGELSDRLRTSLHEDVWRAISYLESNFKYEYTLEELVDGLLAFEHRLLTSNYDELATEESVKYFYNYFFTQIVHNSDENQLFGADGKVKEDVIAAWKRIASNGEQSPSALIMKTIISEMESSGWSLSTSLGRLNSKYINHAVELAKVGELDTFKMYGIVNSGNDIDFVSLPDEYFKKDIEDAYEIYKINYDLTVFEGIHPLVVFGVYYLAYDLEDPVTMWHLYRPEKDSQTMEEYISDWKKRSFLFDEIDTLYFKKDEFNKGTISFERGISPTYNIEMVMTEDEVWKIAEIYNYVMKIFFDN